MRQNGLDQKIKEQAEQGTQILGICGGMQILGKVIEDPLEIESGGHVDALDLLDIYTEYTSKKKVLESNLKFEQVDAPWEILSLKEFSGYEVRFGQSRSNRESKDWISYSQAKNVLGIYMHGLFENKEFLQSLSGQNVEDLDTTFEKLTEAVISGFNPNWLKTFIGITPDMENLND
jgi:adenosylcobyric acid synthase